MELINFSLAKHPINWFVIVLMVMIFGVGLHLVLDFYNITPATKNP